MAPNGLYWPLTTSDGLPHQVLDVSGHHAGDGLLEALPALLAGPKAPACLLLHENLLTATGLEQLAGLMGAAETHPTEVLVVTHEDAHFALTHEVEKLKRPWESAAKRVQSATVQIQQAVAVGRARRRLYPRMRHPRPIDGVPYVMKWPNWAELLHQAAPGSPAGAGMQQSWEPPPTPLSEYGNSPTPRDGVDEDEAEGVHDPAFEAALADPFGGLDFDFAPAAPGTAPGILATPPPPPPPPPDLMGDLMGMDVSGFGSPAMGMTSSGFGASGGSSFTPSFDGNGFGTSIAFTSSFDGNGFGTSFGGNDLGATPTAGSSSFMDGNVPVFSGGFSSVGGNGSFDTSQGFGTSFADAQGFSGGLGEANFSASNGFGVAYGDGSNSSAVAESTSTEQMRPPRPLSPQATTNDELPAGESGVDDEDDFTNFGSPAAVVNSAQAPAPAPEVSNPAPAPAPAMGVAAGAIDADLFTMPPDPPAPAPAPAPAMGVAAGAIDADLFTMATPTQAVDGGVPPISADAAFGSGGFGAGFDTPAGFDSSFNSPAHPEAGAPNPGFGASFDTPAGFESSFSSPPQPEASATTGFVASFDTPAGFAASFSSPAQAEAEVIAGFGASFEAASKSGAGEHNEPPQLSKRFSTSFDPAGDAGSFGASFSDAPAFSGSGFGDGAAAVVTEAAAVGFGGGSGFSDAPAFGSSGGSFSDAPAFFSSGFGSEATKAVDGAPSDGLGNESPNQVSFASETQETTAPSTPPNPPKPRLKTGFSAFSMDGDDDFGMDGGDGMEGNFVSVTPGQSPLGTFAFGSTSFDHETPLSGGGAGEAFSSAFSSAFLDDPFDEPDESTATEPAEAEMTPAEPAEAASVANAPASSATCGESSPFGEAAAFPPASGFGASFETPPEAAAFPPASGFGASFETPPEAAAFPPASGFGASFKTTAAFPPASDFSAGGFGNASFSSAPEPK